MVLTIFLALLKNSYQLNIICIVKSFLSAEVEVILE